MTKTKSSSDRILISALPIPSACNSTIFIDFPSMGKSWLEIYPDGSVPRVGHHFTSVQQFPEEILSRLRALVLCYVLFNVRALLIFKRLLLDYFYKTNQSFSQVNAAGMFWDFPVHTAVDFPGLSTKGVMNVSFFSLYRRKTTHCGTLKHPQTPFLLASVVHQPSRDNPEHCEKNCSRRFFMRTDWKIIHSIFSGSLCNKRSLKFTIERCIDTDREN